MASPGGCPCSETGMFETECNKDGTKENYALAPYCHSSFNHR